MNKVIGIALLMIAVAGCRNEEVLEPFFYPQLLNSSVDFVEVFDDKSMIAGSFEGIYYKNEDGDEFFVEIGDDFEYNQKNIQSMTFFKGGDKVYGVNVNWIVEIKDDEATFYANSIPNVTYGDALRFADYGIDREGKLFAVSYGKYVFDENLWQDFYEIYLNRWQAGSWAGNGTDILIRDLDLMAPSFVFGEDYLYVAVGDIYEVDYKDIFNFDYERLVPNIGGVDYQNMHQLTYQDDALYATNGQGLIGGSPYLMYTFNLRTGNFRDRQFSDRCNVPLFTTMDYQFYHSDGVYAFVRTEVEQETFNSQEVVYIINQAFGLCDRYEIGSNYDVQDVSYDVRANALLLATNQGLITYDLESETTAPYLNTIEER
ncbi:MAG: hypothetical protein Salg2KO_12920 [Salibacteraceae bacterium]